MMIERLWDIMGGCQSILTTTLLMIMRRAMMVMIERLRHYGRVSEYIDHNSADDHEEDDDGDD